MEAEKQLFPEFGSAAPPFDFVTGQTRWQSLALLSVFVLAVILRLYGISLYPIVGDEYGTILEAKRVGLNWNSIIYSTLMHFWIRLGSSELWLRLPAAIFGIATVALLFKVGVKLGGWRAGITTALLAATSPFNIYHSQEVRFYSFFMLAAAAFMLATTSYVGISRPARGRLWIILTGGLLIFSHFFGVITLYAQGVAAFLAKMNERRRATTVAVTCVLTLLLFALPLAGPARSLALDAYQVFGNAPYADLTARSLSLISLVKLVFAGFVLLFGYHVYPLRFLLVIPGAMLCGLFLVRGTFRLVKERQWAALPFLYLISCLGIYVVLDSLSMVGVAPRHTAFVWPIFLVLMALGLSSFRPRIFLVLLTAMLMVNAGSLALGWQKDWTYGVATDHRAANAYVSSWADSDSAMVVDARAYEAAAHYYAANIPRIVSDPGSAEFRQLPYRRMLVVSNDWRANVRRQADEVITRLTDDFVMIDGRVDYPLFQYVLERKSEMGPGSTTETGQLRHPVSIYGIQFQDLTLPVNLTVGKIPLKIIGAYSLPSAAGATEVAFPLLAPRQTKRLILVTSHWGLRDTQNDVSIAEVTLADRSGKVHRFPLRLNRETASWGETCAPGAACQTVFQWHKRVAISGQHSYPGAWRDFQAGMHATTFDLPAEIEVSSVSLRYLVSSGNLYVWAIALSDHRNPND